LRAHTNKYPMLSQQSVNLQQQQQEQQQHQAAMHQAQQQMNAQLMGSDHQHGFANNGLGV